jgi:rare lipoprotein A
MSGPTRTLRLLGVCIVLALLAACSTGRGRGGYYKDDGPDANPPSNLDSVPDAVPKIEPLASGANKPYNIFGRSYVPDVSGGPYREQGRASWYGKKFHGNSTSNGERYDMYAMTAAHRTLPIPSYVRVTRVSNGKTVVLRVNDRGPFHSDRIIDLSYVAAYKLGMLGPGSTEVVVERITPDQIRNWKAAPAPANVAQANAEPVSRAASGSASTPISPATGMAAAGGAAIAGAGAATASTSTATSAAVALTPNLPPTAQLLPPTPPAPAVDPAPAARADIAATSKPTTASAAPSGQLSATAARSPGTPVPPGSMYLQFGAFSEQARAQALAQRLSEQLSPELGRTVHVDQNASNLYRVRIGPFAGREAATQAQSAAQGSTGMAPSLSLP